MGDDPEAGVGMVDDGDGFALGGGDRVVAAEKVNGGVRADAALELEGEVEIEQGWIGRRGDADALLEQRFLPGLIGRHAGGAAAVGAVVVVDLLGEQEIRVLVAGDGLVGEHADEAFLEISESAFDLALGLGIGGDAVGDAEGGERPLELGVGVEAVCSGGMAEEGKSIGVEGCGKAVDKEDGTQEDEVVPGGVGGDEDAAKHLARVVVDGEDEALHRVRQPPAVGRGVVLKEFPDGGGFPAAARSGAAREGRHEEREMHAAGIGDRRARTHESEAALELVGNEREVLRGAVRQEVAQIVHDLRRPGLDSRATRTDRDDLAPVSQPPGAQLVEPGAPDLKPFHRRGRVHFAGIEGAQDRTEILRGEALGDLRFFIGQR